MQTLADHVQNPFALDQDMDAVPPKTSSDPNDRASLIDPSPSNDREPDGAA